MSYIVAFLGILFDLFVVYFPQESVSFIYNYFGFAHIKLVIKVIFFSFCLISHMVIPEANR